MGEKREKSKSKSESKSKSKSKAKSHVDSNAEKAASLPPSKAAAKPQKPKSDRIKAPQPADVGSDDDSSSSEEEDDYGDLVTADVDSGINAVLSAIQHDPNRLLDQSVEFYPKIEAGASKPAPKQKPMYLKDYHRENLLQGKFDIDEEPAVETFVQQQARGKAELLAEIKDQLSDNDGDGSGDDFLVKKVKSLDEKEPELPDAEEDSSGFLKAFLDTKAWIPKNVDEKTGRQKVPGYSEIVKEGEEDSDSFDDLADKFESAYNFRFEDPEAAEIVSYARDESTVRRKESGSRRRARDKKREEREKDEQQRKLQVATLRKTKVADVEQKLKRLYDVLGDEETANAISMEDLEGDWDDTEWDKRMQKLFDEQFYAREDEKWNPAANPEVADANEGVDDAEDDEDMGEKTAENVEDGNDDAIAHEPGSSVPAIKKPSKKELRKQAESFVDANTDLLLDETYIPKATFRYRKVEPESFGLSARDILLADDKQLNNFVGIKHLASFRDQDQMSRTKKKFAKKRRLREWRKEVFETEEEPGLELWEKLKAETQAEQAQTIKDKGKPPKNRKRKPSGPALHNNKRVKK